MMFCPYHGRKENGIERLEDNQRVEFDLARSCGEMSVKTLKVID